MLLLGLWCFVLVGFFMGLTVGTSIDEVTANTIGAWCVALLVLTIVVSFIFVCWRLDYAIF